MNTLLAALLLSQSPTVTFESRAERLSRLLPALSKATGLNLEANGTIEDEVLMISLNKVDRDAFLNSVARATLGKWTPTEGGFILTGDGEARRVLDARRLQAIEALLRRSLERFRQRVLGAPFDEAQAKKLAQEYSNPPKAVPSARPTFDSMLAVFGPFYRAPAGRFAARVLPLIDWKIVAAAPFGERITFSSQPNRLQRPFTESVIDALGRYEVEQKLWIEHARSIPDSQRLAKSTSLDQRGATKVLVSVQNWGLFACEVTVLIRTASGELQRLGGPIRLGEELAEDLYPQTTPAKRAPLALSPESKEILDFLLLRKEKPETPMPAKVEALLYQPRRRELANSISTDIVRSVYADKQNLVARIPDWLAIRPLASPAKVTLASADRLARESLQAETVDGVTLVTPRLIGHATMSRLPRDTWQRIAEQCKAVGSLRLEQAAELASQSRDGLEFELGIEAAKLLSRTGADQEFSYLNLHLFGLFSPAQRKILLGGGSIRNSQMSPAQQAAFQRCLLQNAFENSEINGSFPDANHWNTAPSEFLPNGVPADLQLQSSPDPLPSVFLPGSAQSTSASPLQRLTPSMIAMMIHAQENPSADPHLAKLFGTPHKFYLGQGTRLRLEVKLAEALRLWTNLGDASPDTSRTIEYRNFPPNLLEAVEQERKVWRTATPPPPNIPPP